MVSNLSSVYRIAWRSFHYTRGCTLRRTSKSQGNNQPPCLGQAGQRIGDWRGNGDMNMASNLTDLLAVNIHAAIKYLNMRGQRHQLYRILVLLIQGVGQYH